MKERDHLNATFTRKDLPAGNLVTLPVGPVKGAQVSDKYSRRVKQNITHEAHQKPCKSLVKRIRRGLASACTYTPAKHGKSRSVWLLRGICCSYRPCRGAPVKFKRIPICYERGGRSMNVVARRRQNFAFLIQLRDLLREEAKICPARCV
jgi:hypothetical protein